MRCDNYKEGRIDDIHKLADAIQDANKQDSEYRKNYIQSQKVDMEKWVMTHLKLYALQDRWFRHYGIMNYKDSEPI